jgi:transcriptional regulator with XRE-family HTH domain
MRTDIRKARLAKGLTQAQLAELIGKDQAAISRYESGCLAIDVPTAPLIAQALDMDVLKVLYPATPESSS